MSVRAAVLLAGAALMQVTLLGRLDPVVPEPNIVLALVVARAFLRGARAGMAWGLAGGLMLDLAGTGPLGVHALAMLAAAYAAGALAAGFESGSTAPVALVAAAAAACYSAVVLGAADSLGLAEVTPESALPMVVAGSSVCAAVALPLVLVMRRLVPEPAQPW